MSQTPMGDAFDPYRTWLGISPHEQPPHHYRLLGLSLFENDMALIAGAADRQMAHVRTFQNGPRGGLTQKLLNELSAAKLCLLEPRTKAAYDAALRARFEAQAAQLAAPAAHAWNPPPIPPPVPPPIGDWPAPPVEPPVVSRRAIPLTGANAVHGEKQDEPTGEGEDPIYVRPWFPVAVIGGLLLILGGGYAIGSWMTAPSVPSPPLVVQPEPIPMPMVEPEPMTPVVATTLVAQEGNGDIHLPMLAGVLVDGAGNLSATEETVEVDQLEKVLRWDFRLTKPGFFQVELTYAAGAEQEGGRYRITIGDANRTATVRDAAGAAWLDDGPFILAIPRGGRQTLELRPLEIKGGKLFTLKEVRLIWRQ